LKDLRKDLYMKLGKWFAKNYDLLVMEDIHMRELVGKSLRKLRMRLHDVSFHELKSLLKCHFEKYGKRVILVDPAFTPKACANCGYVREDLTLQDRVFSCPNCGLVLDRDYNASLKHPQKIRAGTALRACGAPPPTLGRGGALKRGTPSGGRGSSH
jgi:putative transposase